MLNTNVTILSGASQSDVIDCQMFVPVALLMPASWTAATITFLAAFDDEEDGGTFRPVYDADGTELAVTVAASRHVVLAPDALRSARWLKLRSGTSGSPVNQGADRVIGVALATDNGA